MDKIRRTDLRVLVLVSAFAAALSLVSLVVRGQDLPDDWRTQDVATTSPDGPIAVVRDSRTTDPTPPVAPLTPVPPAPVTLGFMLGTIAWAIVEGIKAKFKLLANGTWFLKANLTVCIGTVLGVIAGFLPHAPWEAWEAILAGFTGAGGFALVRSGGKALQGVTGVSFKGGPPIALLVACLGLLALSACVSPAVRLGAEVSTCLLEPYVRGDATLTEAQRADRLLLGRQHRILTGAREVCP